MQAYQHYNGVFLPSDSHFVGLLNIAEANSMLKLVGKNFWELHETEYTQIHGVLNDGKKASLLDCVLQGRTRYRFDEYSQCESRFFPNYVVIGEEFIRSDEPVIQAVRYHFENINCLLSGYKTFQSLSTDKNEIHQILKAIHKREEKIAEKHSRGKTPFKPQIGEHPHLLYFSDFREIIACEPKVGKVSLTNRTSRTIGSPAGIDISNEVIANIEFKEPKTLDATIHALHALHGLFELNLGHRQRYRWIELELIHYAKETECETPQTAHLYWNLCNERVMGDSKISSSDTLLAPIRRAEEFSKVTTNWMDSVEVMGDPRVRFRTAFFGGYGINRIVGAANMFDLLPDSHAPKTKETDAQLDDAVMQCKKVFAGLPDGFARQTILSALGRVGRASLRDKIYHRANKIIAVAGDKFPELHLPCNHAVLSRNHYVHGSKGAFDYQKHFTEFAFIIDTLEFVFAFSDLLDLGWDLRGWMDEGPSTTHPFGIYLLNYLHNINRLKSIISK